MLGAGPHGASPIGVALFDRDLRLLGATSGMLATPGAGTALAGPDQTLGPMGRPVAELLGHVLETGEPAPVRLVVSIDDDGGSRQLLCTCVPLHDAEGGITGAGAVVLDVAVVGATTAGGSAAEATAAESRRSLEALQATTVAITGAASTSEAVDVLLGVGLRAAGADSGFVAFVDEDRSVARIAADVGYGAPGSHVGRAFPLDGATAVARTAAAGDLVLAADREDLVRRFPAMAPFLEGSPHASLATLPLRSGERTVGVLGLSYLRPQPFDPAQAASLGVVSELAAAALVRVQLLEAQELARRELAATAERNAFLAEATRLVSTAFDERQVLERLARLCVPRLGDWCSIVRPRGEVLERVLVHHHRPERAGDARRLQGWTIPRSSEVPVAVTFRTGEAQLVHAMDRTMAADPAIPADHVTLVRTLGASTSITVPIGPPNRPLGVLSFSVGPERVLTDDDRQLAAEIALRAGVAVAHAEDFSRERDAAAVLQQAVLPAALPEVAGVDLAAVHRPADGDRLIGGDWFDALHLGGGRVAVVVGDVVGHGIGSAAAMGQVRNALRAYLFEGHGPGPALDRVDRLLRADGAGQHATVVVAVFDGGDGTLTLANAGHPAPLVIAPDGGTALLDGDAHGPLLGAVADAAFPEAVHALAGGTTALLYTDGLVERRRRSLDDTIHELRRRIGAAPPGRDLGAWCEELVAASGRGADQEDDRCVLAVRPTGRPGALPSGGPLHHGIGDGGRPRG